MKNKMTRPISRGKGIERIGFRRNQFSVAAIEAIHIDPVLSQIDSKNKAIARISAYHMRVRSIVAADRKAPRRRIGRGFGAHRTEIVMNIRGRPQSSALQDRK